MQPSESKIPSTLGPETQFSLLFPSPVAILSTSCPAPDQAGDQEGSTKDPLGVTRPRVLGFCRERQSTPYWVWPTLLSEAMLQEAESDQSRRAPSPGKSPAKPFFFPPNYFY